MMMLHKSKLLRKVIFTGAFVSFAMFALALDLAQTEVRLKPPGLRPVSRPTLVIPADFSYLNRPISLPDYCDDAGRPAAGWSSKYIETRRFASDQSAWIYYRNSDLKLLVVKETAALGSTLRIWPGGAKLVIEIFKGHASIRKNANLIEIAVMSKLESKTGTTSTDKIFFTPSWSFARFKPSGSAFITPAKVMECHQCHSIAFHLTGDLIFTRLP
jgi:hypothetical protein